MHWGFSFLKKSSPKKTVCASLEPSTSQGQCHIGGVMTGICCIPERAVMTVNNRKKEKKEPKGHRSCIQTAERKTNLDHSIGHRLHSSASDTHPLLYSLSPNPPFPAVSTPFTPTLTPYQRRIAYKNVERLCYDHRRRRRVGPFP